MFLRILGLSALLPLLAAVSCIDDEEPTRFTTAGTCVSGDTEPCDCPDTEDGSRFCTPDGTFGECACPGCTAAPDCDDCGSCVDRCMCETERVHDESLCRDNCIALGELDGRTDEGDDAGDPGTGGEDSGSEPPAGCDPAGCPGSTGALQLPGCCAPEDTCGYSFQQMCVAANQPGEPDPDCPPLDLMGFMLAGCCRPDGNCGVQDDFVGFGCFDASALGGSATPCDPIR